MKLQDRNLDTGMRGKDVELLQQELRQLGFAIEDEAGHFDLTTRRAVEQFQKQHGLGMTGVVDERTATLINDAVQALDPNAGGDDEVSSFVVRGHVRKADGSPLIEAIVRAFDKDLRHEERLGEAVTDGSGRYEIAYTAAQFRRAEKKRADLIVRVFGKQDQELIASDILFNAQTEEMVNLMIGGGEYRGPSEYEQLLAEITPVLENVPLTELSEEKGTCGTELAK
jgi:peptidoglycan hydrolase-like protein with peptidoglycan-binding domain